METVLITGANGFVGSYLAQLLLKNGYRVIATGRGVARISTSPFLLYEEMDFTNAVSVKKVFDQWKPDIVVHSGALSGVDQCEQDRASALTINVQGTCLLLENAGTHGSFF